MDVESWCQLRVLGVPSSPCRHGPLKARTLGVARRAGSEVRLVLSARHDEPCSAGAHGFDRLCTMTTPATMYCDHRESSTGRRCWGVGLRAARHAALMLVAIYSPRWQDDGRRVLLAWGATGATPPSARGPRHAVP